VGIPVPSRVSVEDVGRKRADHMPRSLSGIGDKDALAEHNIPVIADLPDVGKNLFDHMMLFRYWKLCHPERGLALGSPLFGGPNYEKGGPIDWLVTTPIPHGPLKAALEKDAGGPVADDHPLLAGPRSHLEMNLLYAALGTEAIGLKLPLDGTSIMTFCMGCLPTSRGSVSLASTNPADQPVIDPNYYATEMDRHVMREGYRMQSRLMFDTKEGRELIVDEHVPESFTAEELGVGASDEAIDRRIGLGGSTVFHPAGTAAMGKVVDGELKVRGLQNLSVVDASVVSIPMCGGAGFVGGLLTTCRFHCRWRRTIKLLCMRSRSGLQIFSRATGSTLAFAITGSFFC
jgi:hypothetical protein